MSRSIGSAYHTRLGCIRAVVYVQEALRLGDAYDEVCASAAKKVKECKQMQDTIKTMTSELAAARMQIAATGKVSMFVKHTPLGGNARISNWAM